MYRWLLHLFPSQFRAEYGDEMTRDFAHKKRATKGASSQALLWVSTLFDMAWNALAAHYDLLQQDLRYTTRTIARAPGFAASVILVGALAVGATTAVFTVADHVLLRPLPFANSDRLIRMWQSQPGYNRMELSPPNYQDWKRMSQSFEQMVAIASWSTSMIGRGEPLQLEGAQIGTELLPMLGVKPLIGRWFTTEEERNSASGVIIIGHGVWQSRFAGQSNIIGEKVVLDGDPHTVIGVMPPDFAFPNREAQIWRPLRYAPRDLQDRNNNYLDIIALRKPGLSLEQAREEMKLITTQLERQYPKENAKVRATLLPLRDQVPSQSRMLVQALAVASLCVLLIACTNLANLLMARALSKQKELSVRASLGAGAQRIVRQLLTESLLLAGLGGILGVALAYAILPLLLRLAPTSLPIPEPSIDARVLLFAVGITILTGLLFGTLPALRACRDGSSGVSSGHLAAGLREGARGGIGGRKQKLRGALVVAEVAMCVSLLIASGLLLRALWRLQSIDPGFQASGVLTLRTALPIPKYQNVAPRQAFYNHVLNGVQTLPGVESVGMTSFLPIVLRGGIWAVDIGGQNQQRSENHTASLRYITPGYLPAMGIPVKRGRGLAESDGAQSLPVAVVSESFVKRYWPNENPIGRSFKIAFDSPTIVGVVKDVRVRGLEAESEPQVYLSYRQMRDGVLSWYAPKDLAVRSLGDPSSLLPAIRRLVQEADPEQPISDIQTLTEIVEANTATRTVQARVLGAFAAIAFLLASVGIHGLLSFVVSERTQEFGVRMALGARPQQILKLILGESTRLALAGVLVGAFLGYAAGRGLQSLLAGLDPADGLTFAAAMLLAAIMTMAGSALPTLRAVRVDPASVIRS